MVNGAKQQFRTWEFASSSPSWAVVAAMAIGLAVIGTLMLLAGNLNRPSYSGPTDDLHVGLIGEYASLIILAEQQGYFKENGLHVAITEYGSGPESLAALSRGEVDMAVASDFAGVSDIMEGRQLRVLGTLSKSDAFHIVARKDRGITSEADLRGKKIGITRKTVGEFYLGQFLVFNNIPAADVQLQDMPQASLIDNLANGTIDAAVVFEPNAYRATQRLGANAVRWSVQGSQRIYSLLYTTNNLIQHKPEVITRYLRSLVKAEEFAENETGRAKEIIAKAFDYGRDYVDDMWTKFTFEMTLDQELLLNMDNEARWLIGNRLTKATSGPNFMDTLYFDALEAVKPKGITVIR